MGHRKSRNHSHQKETNPSTQALSSLMSRFPKPLIELQKQRELLQLQVETAKAKLRFSGSSEPMNQYALELSKQELALSCQLNEMLVNLYNHRA